MSVDYQIENPDIVVNTSQARLLLELAPDYVLLAVLNLENNQFIGLQYINLQKHDTLNHFREVMVHNKWLTNSYSSVNVVYNFPDTLWSPAEGFSQEDAAAYLNLTYGDVNRGEVFVDEVTNWRMLNLYRVPASVYNIVTTRFPGTIGVHSQTAFLKRLKEYYDIASGETAFVSFYERRLLLVCFRNGALLLLKTFDYETAEDVNYHLLNAFQQLSLDCETSQLYVSGLLDTQSSVYAALQKYFRHVTLDVRSSAFSYSESFDEYPPHFFTPLFGIALCV